MDDRWQRARRRPQRDDERVLAAVARAVLHGPAHLPGAPQQAILEHLEIPRRSPRARALGARLGELRRRGLLSCSARGGLTLWSLTAEGSERLARARRSSRPPSLPESPQHRAWRGARVAAREELARFQRTLEQGLALGALMLAASRAGAPEAPHSDAWLELGRRLQGDCRRLGSAWHCLHEWTEPSDDAADRDRQASDEVPARLRALRAGRRNARLWAEPD